MVIVDIADGNRVLVDEPLSGFPRTLYPLKRLTLTNLKVKILRGARTGTLKYTFLSTNTYIGRH